MLLDAPGDQAGELLPTDRQRATRRNASSIGALQDQGVQAAQLCLEQAARAIRKIGTKRVAAYQLGKAGGYVSRRGPLWAHLPESYRHTTLRDLPGCFTARQPAADYIDVLQTT